jgi:hypothetical protein
MTNRRKSEQPALVASLSKGGRKGYAPREEIGKIYGSLRDSQHHLNNALECPVNIVTSLACTPDRQAPG